MLSSYEKPFYYEDMMPKKSAWSWMIIDFTNNPEVYASQLDEARRRLANHRVIKDDTYPRLII